MDIFQKYNDLYNELYNGAWAGLFGDLSYDWLKPGAKWMESTLKTIRDNYTSDINIDNSDLKQILKLIWLESEKAYLKNNPRVSLKTYLVRRSVWGMRDWLIRESRIVKENPYYYFIEEKPEFLLDLSFLLYGTQVEPFHVLSPYERYLIFLKYKEEKHMFQIARIVQKDEKTVRKQLKNILFKLRSSNEEEDTSRPCDRSTGTGSSIETLC